MTTLPVADARAQLSKLIDEAATTDERFEITRNGHRAAVLLSGDDYDVMQETSSVLSDTALREAHQQGLREIAAGEYVDGAGLATLLAPTSGANLDRPSRGLPDPVPHRSPERDCDGDRGPAPIGCLPRLVNLTRVPSLGHDDHPRFSIIGIVVSALIDATDESAAIRTLIKRRRITHVVAVVLLIVIIVDLIAEPNPSDEATAATMIGGISVLLLLAAVIASVQYTVRIRMRRAALARRREGGIPPTSAAFQPIQQLRSAQLLLASVLPKIEQVKPGMTVTAGQAESSLDQVAQQVVLQEQVFQTLSSSGHDPAQRAEMQRNLQMLAMRLRSGVDQYTSFAQQASITSVSLGDLTDRNAIQDATDQLTGLAHGLEEVQRISDIN